MKHGDYLGDSYRTCPQEWSEKSARITAVTMLGAHGVAVALARAKQHRVLHKPGTWGDKHWVLVVKLLAKARLKG